MSGFYTKCLINIDEVLDFDWNLVASHICSNFALRKYFGDFDIKSGIGQAKRLARALQTQKVMHTVLHNEAYLDIKTALYNFLVEDIADALNDDEDDGCIPGTDYYVADVARMNSDDPDALVFGQSEPEKIIAYAETMKEKTMSHARGTIADSGLWNASINHDLIDHLCSENGKDDLFRLREALQVLDGEVNMFSPTSCYIDGQMESYPSEHEIAMVKEHPEKYAIIELLLK